MLTSWAMAIRPPVPLGAQAHPLAGRRTHAHEVEDLLPGEHDLDRSFNTRAAIAARIVSEWMPSLEPNPPPTYGAIT